MPRVEEVDGKIPELSGSVFWELPRALFLPMPPNTPEAQPRGSVETLPTRRSGKSLPAADLLRRGSLGPPPELSMEQVREGPENMHFK